MRLTIVERGTGTPDVHRAGCSDVSITGAVLRGGVVYTEEYESRREVAAEWYGDIAAENLCDPSEYISELHFLPCCAEFE